MTPPYPSLLGALAGVANASEPLPGLATGGQPAEAHLRALRDAGAAVVLDIRDPMEARPFDEVAAVGGIGMRYINVPVTSGALSDETMERILAVLRNRSENAVFLHCASGNRVGGPLIAHLVLDNGMDEDDAVEIAMRAGLRSAELMEWGLDYARRKAG
jgi:protein tyrosine phosphatase (PTP) superfamily phosphohydrolase (DUF442 family)